MQSINRVKNISHSLSDLVTAVKDHTFESFMSLLLTISFLIFEITNNYNNIFLVIIFGIFALIRIRERDASLHVNNLITRLANSVINLGEKFNENEKTKDTLRVELNSMRRALNGLLRNSTPETNNNRGNTKIDGRTSESNIKI